MEITQKEFNISGSVNCEIEKLDFSLDTLDEIIEFEQKENIKIDLKSLIYEKEKVEYISKNISKIIPPIHR